MSNCDNMQVIIKNQATGIEGENITATIVGVNEIRGTIRDLSINQEISHGSQAVGHAFSSGGSNGWTEGEIQVKLLWGTVAEVLTLKYEGEKQAFGRDCLPHPQGSTTTYFVATISSSSGKGDKCTQTFLLESTSQANA